MGAMVGILSDSHGRAERTARAVRALQDAGARTLIHAGDIETPEVLDAIAGPDTHVVWGNCDWDRGSLERYARSISIAVHGDLGRVEVPGLAIAVTHGHLPARVREAMVSGAPVVVYGHSHERRDETIDGVRMINPGALHRANPFTVALLDAESGALRTIEVE